MNCPSSDNRSVTWIARPQLQITTKRVCVSTQTKNTTNDIGRRSGRLASWHPGYIIHLFLQCHCHEWRLLSPLFFDETLQTRSQLFETERSLPLTVCECSSCLSLPAVTCHSFSSPSLLPFHITALSTISHLYSYLHLLSASRPIRPLHASPARYVCESSLLMNIAPQTKLTLIHLTICIDSSCNSLPMAVTSFSLLPHRRQVCLLILSSTLASPCAVELCNHHSLHQHAITMWYYLMACLSVSQTAEAAAVESTFKYASRRLPTVYQCDDASSEWAHELSPPAFLLT